MALAVQFIYKKVQMSLLQHNNECDSVNFTSFTDHHRSAISGGCLFYPISSMAVGTAVGKTSGSDSAIGTGFFFTGFISAVLGSGSVRGSDQHLSEVPCSSLPA